jgi:hypothetical protein
MAFVVSATQPPGGSLGDEWFNPNTNELRKLVALNGTTVSYVTVNVGGTSSNTTSNIFSTNTITIGVTTFASNVIISAGGASTAPAWMSALGGNIVTANNFTYHTFNTSSTFALTLGIGTGNVLYNSAQVLIIGGGAGGGGFIGGGGGAGGFFETTISNLISGTYRIIIGAGGAGGTGATAPTAYGANGFSSFANIIPAGSFSALYGGGGGFYGPPAGIGFQGASGGGASAGGSGQPRAGQPSIAPLQGFAGGNNFPQDGAGAGGGGGGAGGVGGNGGPNTGGTGGPGKISSINGWNAYFSAGGGGSGGDNPLSVPGNGGISGGGSGGTRINNPGANANAFTGGGGGAGGMGPNPNGSTAIGGNGGSGTIIIRYQSS